jgi:KDO2-lipid IV(A) lauroyltransferase
MTSTRIAVVEDPTCGVPIQPLSRYWAPRWWPTWAGLGLIRLLAIVPWAWQSRIAGLLGNLSWQLARRDRHTTLVNLALAYPRLSKPERMALAKAHFRSLTWSLAEIGLVWFGRRSQLGNLVRIEGVEHLTAALARGKGVLLLGAHFTTNEIAAAALPLTGHRFDIMYKPSSNELINQLALRRRIRHGGRMIPSDRFVDMLKALQRGGIVLYAPDQRFDGQGHISVPLFGVPALANPGTTFVARATKCAVLTYFPRRLADGQGYVMTIGAPLADFPSLDATQDVTRYHHLIEHTVTDAPEQYLWSYKRFRPAAGEPDPYRQRASRDCA